MVVEDAYRGTVERGYADCFYLARVLSAQLDGLEVYLRGPAATLALAAPGGAPGESEDHLGENLRGLVASGVRVMVCQGDLAARSRSPHRLLTGVELVDGPRCVASWADYDAVWMA